MRIILGVLGIFILSGCADTGRVFPLDDAAMNAGIPKFEFVRQGIGRGPVTVTMPDGEILTGAYQVTENAAVGVGFAGGQSATAIAMGSGRHTTASAVGPHTIMNCDLILDIGGHGSGTCQTNRGMQYRVMI